MIILAAVVVLICAWSGTAMFRAGRLTWRNLPCPAWLTRPNPAVSKGLQQGIVRALVPEAVFLWLVSCLILAVDFLGLAGESANKHGWGTTVLMIFLVAILVGTAVSGLLVGVIVTLNRPRFLVPPQFRDQLGSLAEDRRERRRA
ncbi:hypothetical protein [Streptacidiphilus rugosus]|uniref:hypothetical protein n=1 Tax=Streptacidiphilus rugosus TaxID=405783 RepID=UPI00056D3812|nr:hypothetical protein [Streptacidiphilus rugosus]